METTSPGVKLIECPRDAMQGWQHFIPTEKKIAYLNALLRAGFDTIDFGSFVSPKAIPQMADTGEVLQQLQLQASHSKLLAIVANVRGAEQASGEEEPLIAARGHGPDPGPLAAMRHVDRDVEPVMVEHRQGEFPARIGRRRAA